jgi:putative peptide zinc metalloprotease protein
LPVNFSVNLPAVLHAEHYRAIYPPAPSLVEALLVQEGQVVQEGDILLQQSSFAIENEWKKTKEKLAALEILKQREQTDAKIYHERGGRLDQQIDLANKEFTAADYKKKQLTLRAPFTGIVRDLSPEIRTGRSLSQQDLLFRLVDPIAQTVTGYIRESDLSRIRSGAKARFRPAYALWASVPLEVESIEAVNAQAIVWPELASVYGGSLPSAKQQEGPISPLEPIYTVRFKVLKNTIENQSFITKGNVVVQASPSSGLMVFVRNMLSLFTRESSFN